MEIDVKKETEKVQGEMQELATQINSLDQQRQEAVNQLIKKQGELEYLQRLNGEKKESPPKK